MNPYRNPLLMYLSQRYVFKQCLPNETNCFVTYLTFYSYNKALMATSRSFISLSRLLNSLLRLTKKKVGMFFTE